MVTATSGYTNRDRTPSGVDAWGRYVVPQAGDFFLAPIAGWAGLGIETGQWLMGDGFDPVQHAAMYLGDGLLVQAMPHGATEVTLSGHYPDFSKLVWSTGLIKPTAKQRLVLVDKAYDYVGTPYSDLDYLSLAAAHFGLRPAALKRYIASTGHMICSQLVDQCYQDAGIQLFNDGRFAGDVTPGSLYTLLGRIYRAQQAEIKRLADPAL